MLFISIVFTLFSIQCKKYLNETHDQVSPPKQSHSGGTGADYQNQPPTCMPGYYPVCECSNRVNNNKGTTVQIELTTKEQQKGTTLSNYVSMF